MWATIAARAASLCCSSSASKIRMCSSKAARRLAGVPVIRLHDVRHTADGAQLLGDLERPGRGVVGVLGQLATDGVRASLRDPRPCDLLLGLREQDEGAQLVDELGVVGHDEGTTPKIRG